MSLPAIVVVVVGVVVVVVVEVVVVVGVVVVVVVVEPVVVVVDPVVVVGDEVVVVDPVVVVVGLVAWALDGDNCMEEITGGTQIKPLNATPRRNASRLVSPGLSVSGA
jgi:hypothetical protein